MNLQVYKKTMLFISFLIIVMYITFATCWIISYYYDFRYGTVAPFFEIRGNIRMLSEKFIYVFYLVFFICNVFFNKKSYLLKKLLMLIIIPISIMIVATVFVLFSYFMTQSLAGYGNFYEPLYITVYMLFIFIILSILYVVHIPE